jgi:hypothetical protein
MMNDKLSAKENIAGVGIPSEAELDALARAPRQDWAWTFLRRNSDYRVAALQNRQHWLAANATELEPMIFRSTARQLAAEEWGLCTFRRP